MEIHAPRVGGDPWPRPPRPAYKHFNPRPPCGGRPLSTPDRWRCWHFNPRPPCGGRLAQARLIQELEVFQSTPPVWGATRAGRTAHRLFCISIHAPRVGGDLLNQDKTLHKSHFNPRPPCGGRRYPYSYLDHDGDISIHAPRVGGDVKSSESVLRRFGISIHAPRVGGDCGAFALVGKVSISIHAPRVGGDNC